MKTLSILVTLSIFLAFIGCTKDDTISSQLSSDEQAIQEIVANSDSISGFSQSDESLIDDPSESSSTLVQQNSMQLSKMGFDATNAQVKVFRWNRRVVSIDRNVVVTNINDSSAVAVITKIVTGNIVISASYSDTASFPDTVIRKPFREQLVRKVLLSKVGRFKEALRNWRPVAISLVAGNTLSDSVNSFFIMNLQVYSPADTFTVTNPLATWLKFGKVKHGLPQLRHTDSITVRVTVFSTNDSVESVVTRWNGERNNFREKMKLVSNTQVSGGYERVFEMNVRTHLPHGKAIGRCNVIADVFSYGSITDDSIAVSNRLWGFPYDVKW